MSKKLKDFKKKARIVRKQIQIFCYTCLLPCSAAIFVFTDQTNEQNIENFKPTTQVVA
ncbi:MULTISPECIES: hypothetical protein [Acinetobacter]|jgi:ABC-type nickel/cobalt efflux system permease component RcnA|uniref:hypothetical protein n=1 Tax=Acinetobacter TaxID=469 RepID=UPI00132F5589|nr:MULTISPECIES: hypothetical protein [Acinetobacter]UBQ38484.1 hypothetical protein LCH18_03560 [Acinetobacter johnsonii]